MNIKLFLFPIFFLSIYTSGIAQKGSFSISPTIGLNVPILDNGSGFHFGVNPAYAVSAWFAIEGQLSFAHVNINGSFISGKVGSQSNFNALVGGRFYILSEKKKVRPYFNLLLGGMHNSEFDYEEFTFGLSTGLFFDINQFLVGVSFETPGNIILKGGYAF